MATNYTITVTNDDNSTTMVTVSDSVAEGETDVFEVTVEDPSPRADLTQTSGN